MVIADTGFWIALANVDDNYHELAREAYKRIREPYITTWPVMTETCHLLLKKMGPEAQTLFLRNFSKKAFEVFDLAEEHAFRLNELMVQYMKLPIDLADASLIILAEHLGRGDILSTDQRDFRTYRWKNHKPFRNLLIQD